MSTIKISQLPVATTPLSGAEQIPLVQSGVTKRTTATALGVNRVVSVKSFGAVGDGIADDTAAIQAAITYAATLTAPILVVDQGVYFTTSVLSFDLPNYSTIQFIGEIKSNVSADSAIRIGSTSTNRFGYYITGVKVYRTANDTTSGSIGVQLRSIVGAYVDIRRVSGFQDGIYCFGTSSNGGFSYNEVHMGIVHDNKVNLHLGASGVGYCNENNFYGGSFNHSSGYPAVATVNLQIDHFVTNQLNSNRFFGPSFEDNSLLAVAANINGFNNVIFCPRMERSVGQSTYQIVFQANSTECSVFGYGFVVDSGNISDLGGGNSYQTRDGTFYQAQAGTGATEGVYRARSTTTGSAKVFRADDTSGNVQNYMDGNGLIVAASRVYGEAGVRWSTSSGTFNDRGIFAGSVSPEGATTADAGSFYGKTNGGAGQTLWVKESGSGNTGWKAALTQPEEVAAADIAAVANAINTAGKFQGKLVWDSTNNRMMRAAGSSAASVWWVIDGSTSVTPA